MVISAARLQELLAGGETGEVEFKLNAPAPPSWPSASVASPIAAPAG